MKKIIISVIIVILLAVTLTANYIGGAEFTEGKYKIQDFAEYPDAYIEVKGNTIQFYNIDLNAIYRDYQVAEYRKALTKGFPVKLDEEGIKKASDFNARFVDEPFELDFSDSKTGTFTYIHYCLDDESEMFRLIIIYDSLHKTIRINNAEQEILFKK